MRCQTIVSKPIYLKCHSARSYTHILGLGDAPRAAFDTSVVSSQTIRRKQSFISQFHPHPYHSLARNQPFALEKLMALSSLILRRCGEVKGPKPRTHRCHAPSNVPQHEARQYSGNDIVIRSNTASSTRVSLVVVRRHNM